MSDDGQTTQAFNFGDVHDDDGQVFDRLFQENPEPELPFPDTSGTVPAQNIVVPTRLITGTRTLTAPTSALDTHPVLLLPRDPKRCDVSLFFTPVDTVANLGPITNTGAAVTGPGAFTIIATIPAASLPAGWYDINAVMQTYGTTASPTDDNNFRVIVGSATFLENPVEYYSGTTGGGRVERNYRYYLDGTQQLRIGTIGAATATAVYDASLMATRVTDETGITGQAPVLLGYDQASLQTEGVSARINVANLTAPITLPMHTGEIWATMIPVPDTAFTTLKVSWIATSR